MHENNSNTKYVSLPFIVFKTFEVKTTVDVNDFVSKIFVDGFEIINIKYGDDKPYVVYSNRILIVGSNFLDSQTNNDVVLKDNLSDILNNKNEGVNFVNKYLFQLIKFIDNGNINVGLDWFIDNLICKKISFYQYESTTKESKESIIDNQNKENNMQQHEVRTKEKIFALIEVNKLLIRQINALNSLIEKNYNTIEDATILKYKLECQNLINKNIEKITILCEQF